MAKFKRGGKKPPNSGRRAGTPNRSTREIKEIARELLDETYFQVLRLRLLNGKCAPQLEVALFHYAHGRPKETIAIEGDQRITLAQFRALCAEVEDDERDDRDDDSKKPPPKPKAPRVQAKGATKKKKRKLVRAR